MLLYQKETNGANSNYPVYRLLREAKRHAPPPGALDLTPIGLEENRRNLEVAIDYIYQQRLIPRRDAVDELFDDVTRNLER